MDGSCSEKSSDEDHAVVALCDHPLAPRGTFTGTTWHRAAAGASGQRCAGVVARPRV